LFKRHKTQLTINELEIKLDIRDCDSQDYEAHYEEGKEVDLRATRSFPNSPRAYKNFDGADLGNFGRQDDNVYAEGKDPAPKDKGKEYSEMGT